MNKTQCRYCYNNNTLISPNQQYLFCQDCHHYCFYKCFCNSFDFYRISPSSATVKCNSCGLFSFVPEHLAVDQESKEFVRQAKIDNTTDPTNTTNTPGYFDGFMQWLGIQ